MIYVQKKETVTARKTPDSKPEVKTRWRVVGKTLDVKTANKLIGTLKREGPAGAEYRITEVVN